MFFADDWFGYSSYYDNVGRLAGLNRPVKILEVGVFEGRSTCHLAQQLGKNKVDAEFHACDLFVGEFFSQRLNLSPDRNFRFIVEYNLHSLKLLEKVILHTASSFEVLSSFPDSSLDFIFLDGDHSEETVTTEIELAIRKIKPTGIIGGHDYDVPSVKSAVDKFLPVKDYEGHVWEYEISSGYNIPFKREQIC
jgi:hypothetical protein